MRTLRVGIQSTLYTEFGAKSNFSHSPNCNINISCKNKSEYLN